MLHVKYLFRLSLDYQICHESKELNEKIFVKQIYLNRRVKYIITFIYNAYESYILI